jgi:hypothetical protein
MHTLTRTTLRELVADVLRDHRGDAPGDQADALMDLIKTYAPKAFTEERLDVDTSPDAKYNAIAEEMIRSAAFDIDTWQINAAYPRLTDEEVRLVDDAIGAASIVVNF